jgi:Domain of unknown function (DUF4062)/inactive STAND
MVELIMADNEICKVFISATAKDMEAYRRDLQSALTLIEIQSLLQEEWADAAADVVTLCLDRLNETDGYVGIFGFRYGWIPNGYDRSITELECDHAFERWRRLPYPPVFLYMPAPGSKAAQQLEQRAETILTEEYPNDENKRQASRERQRVLRERLMGNGKFSGSFTDDADLKIKVLASVANWNRKIFRNASPNTRGALSDIPLASLGEIGREHQLEALEEGLLAFRESSSPGLCVLIHGPEDAGQHAFLRFLCERDMLEIDSQPILITPPYERFDVASLRNAASVALTGDKAPPAASIDALADAISKQCAEDSVLLITGRLESLQGGVNALYHEFWTPLVKAVRTSNRQTASRFILIATLSEILRDVLPEAHEGTRTGEPTDASSIMVLPELGPISEVDVANWLKQFDLDIRARKALAADAVADGDSPAAVFARLNARNFWRSLKQKRKP